MMFKLWSEKNNEANGLLSPTLGLRDWNDLSHEEKDRMWQYIRYWFIENKEGRNTRVFFQFIS